MCISIFKYDIKYQGTIIEQPAPNNLKTYFERFEHILSGKFVQEFIITNLNLGLNGQYNSDKD